MSSEGRFGRVRLTLRYSTQRQRLIIVIHQCTWVVVVQTHSVSEILLSSLIPCYFNQHWHVFLLFWLLSCCVSRILSERLQAFIILSFCCVVAAIAIDGHSIYWIFYPVWYLLRGEGYAGHCFVVSLSY